MKILKRILLALLILVVLAVISGLIFVRHISHRAIPDYNAELVIDGLSEQVEVYRDQYGVPHVYAKNEHDLYLAVGYISAQDRLWQMDLLRRVTQGRLSEIFGEDMITADQLFRALRFDRKSEQMLGGLPADMMQNLEAYSQGINTYIDQNFNRLPFEFSVLGYQPEPWKPEHSANITGYFTWGLTNPWGTEFAMFEIAQVVGNEKMMELLPDLDIQTPVYDHYGETEGLVLEDNILQGSLKAVELGLEIFSGSNNWAISGDKTESGFPIVANDMHLQIDLAPGVWYQMHQVVEGGLNVTGVMAPGTPIIAAGHNDSIAWGFTNVGVDDMDFYLETINPEDTNQYRLDGQWMDMQIREETIRIKGGEEVTRVNRFTHRGPVISGFKGVDEHVISMRWLGMGESNEFIALFQYDRANNWEDFKAAAIHQSTLSQNVIYGDRAGNIGLYTCAGIPIRNAGKGIFVVPGDTSLYDWTGRVPFDELPHIYNPEKGYVISANNKTVPASFPYHISTWFSLPCRYDRIDELIREKGTLSAEDVQEIQTDQTSKWAEGFQNRIITALSAADLDELETEVLDIFKSWDCNMTVESSATLVFEVFYEELVKNMFQDEMGEELYTTFTKSDIIAEYTFEKILAGQEISWCDDVSTDQTEDFDKMIIKSFQGAVSWISERYSSDPDQWHWGEVHKITFGHALSSVNLLSKVFGLTRGPYSVGGSGTTVAPYSYSFGTQFKAYHGASERHVFTTDDWDKSKTVIPTGVSGIPASDFFCNQSELYINKQYHDDFFSKEKVQAAAVYHSVFKPGGE